MRTLKPAELSRMGKIWKKPRKAEFRPSCSRIEFRRPGNTEQKVTQCVIFIQENMRNGIDSVWKWDTFLTKTAVKKYYIGLFTDYKIMDNLWQRYYGGPREAILPYPMIRIGLSFKDLAFLVCPTIDSGTVIFIVFQFLQYFGSLCTIV